MKILIISPTIPYPATEGGKISQYAFIDYLRKMHDITIALYIYSDEDEKNINALKELWENVKIKTTNCRISDNQKLGYKEKVIKFLKKTYHRISPIEILPNITLAPSAFNITSAKSENFIQSLINIVNEDEFDIIQVEFLEFVDLAMALPEKIKKIFIHHELRFSRLESEIQSKNDLGDTFKNYALNYVKDRELNFLKWYDAVFTFSEIDKEKLNAQFDSVKIYSSPFPVLDNHFVSIQKDHFRIDKIIFVGGEMHHPNKDAINWYCDEIAPFITVSSSIMLEVIGNWDKNTIKSFSSNNNISFVGFVDDLIESCKNSIMIVPLRIGSGIRTKILYAMAQGIPVISTSIGCEGLNMVNKHDILIEDDPAQFASAILKLINDNDLAYNIALNGQQLVRRHFGQKSLSEQRSEFYYEILKS